jgi:fructokinase
MPEQPTPLSAICAGELLWDVYPTTRHLGGAPPNVAVHLRALGVPSRVASRVGTDEAGAALRARLEQLGVPADLVQTDRDHPTGVVTVDLSDPRDPRYTIEQPAAWDFIELSEELEDSASRAAAIVFGSLAQRSQVSRASILALLSPGPLRVFDVNLRPPFDDRAIVESSLRRSDLVKLNDLELGVMLSWFDLPQGDRAGCEALCDRFGCSSVCVTRGPNGAALLHGGAWWEHPGYDVEVVDTVGSGDAFLAALLSRLMAGVPPDRALRSANAVGAYVATQPGATPPLDAAIIGLLSGEPL